MKKVRNVAFPVVNDLKFSPQIALRENMEIQNKNDELTRELLQVRRESAERFNLQRTIEKYVLMKNSSPLDCFTKNSLNVLASRSNRSIWLRRTRNYKRNSKKFYLKVLRTKVCDCFRGEAL